MQSPEKQVICYLGRATEKKPPHMQPSPKVNPSQIAKTLALIDNLPGLTPTACASRDLDPTRKDKVVYVAVQKLPHIPQRLIGIFTDYLECRPHITNLAGAACKKYKLPKAAFTAHPQLLSVYEQEFILAQQKLEIKTAEDNGTKRKWSNNQQHQTTQFFTASPPQTT
eukprot:8197117-Ditylum_brightwellii.AAC.1